MSKLIKAKNALAMYSAWLISKKEFKQATWEYSEHPSFKPFI